jgi:hypothetical protein
MELRALSSLPLKISWVGKTQRGAWTTQDLSGYVWAGERYDGESASGAVNSGGLFKRKLF